MLCVASPAGAETAFEQRFGLRRVDMFPLRPVVVRPGRNSVYRLGTVRFPRGAEQGPKTWYVGRLRFRLGFASLPPESRVYVSADTGTRTFAQIELEPAGRSVRWSTYDLFLGETSETVGRGTVEISFHNYLQNRGVRPGAVPVRLHVEQFGGARVDELTVFPDSALETTTRSPTPLSIRLEALTPDPREHERFRVQMTLATETSGDLIKRVSVEPLHNPRLLRLVEPKAPASFANLGGTVVKTFTFEPLAAGRHHVLFMAHSSLNSPRAVLTVDVAAQQERSFDFPFWIGVVLICLGVVVPGTVLLDRAVLRA